MKRHKQSKNSKKPRELDEVDYFIISKILFNPGITDRELVDELKGKYVRMEINKRRRNPLVQAALRKPAEEAHKIIKRQKVLAAMRMRRHLVSEKEIISLKACQSVLENELKTSPIVIADISGFAAAWRNKLSEDEAE
jgi:hypothetical protein